MAKDACKIAAEISRELVKPWNDVFNKVLNKNIPDELDALLARLQTGHDEGCAMSYGMHEHCCDCSYPDRQAAAAALRALREEKDDALDNVRAADRHIESLKDKYDVETKNARLWLNEYNNLRVAMDDSVNRCMKHLDDLDAARADAAALRLEIASMRSSDWHKDAERYRWLRKIGPEQDYVISCDNSEDDLDEAIDAAIREGG